MSSINYHSEWLPLRLRLESLNLELRVRCYWKLSRHTCTTISLGWSKSCRPVLGFKQSDFEAITIRLFYFLGSSWGFFHQTWLFVWWRRRSFTWLRRDLRLLESYGFSWRFVDLSRPSRRLCRLHDFLVLSRNAFMTYRTSETTQAITLVLANSIT